MSDKANLARIRDNQRRSRARRKDYLQELEVKFRTCEAAGVEASAEIQAAARRVLEENKRLRQLLKQQGLTDAEIDGPSLRLSMSGSTQRSMRENPQFPSPASTLEQMLGTRRACNSDSGHSGCTVTTQSDLNQPLTPAAPLQQQPNLHLTRPMAARASIDFGSTHEQSSADVTSTTTPSSALFPPTQSTYESYDAQPQRVYNYSVTMEQPEQWHSSSTWESQLQQQPSRYAHDASIIQQDVSQYQNPNSSSCNNAASIIYTINSNAPREDVQRALGCSEGQECAVDNNVLFDLMDRYSG